MHCRFVARSISACSVRSTHAAHVQQPPSQPPPRHSTRFVYCFAPPTTRRSINTALVYLKLATCLPMCATASLSRSFTPSSLSFSPSHPFFVFAPSQMSITTAANNTISCTPSPFTGRYDKWDMGSAPLWFNAYCTPKAALSLGDHQFRHTVSRGFCRFLFPPLTFLFVRLQMIVLTGDNDAPIGLEVRVSPTLDFSSSTWMDMALLPSSSSACLAYW